jgi:hypothetical protein
MWYGAVKKALTRPKVVFLQLNFRALINAQKNNLSLAPRLNKKAAQLGGFFIFAIPPLFSVGLALMNIQRIGDGRPGFI